MGKKQGGGIGWFLLVVLVVGVFLWREGFFTSSDVGTLVEGGTEVEVVDSDAGGLLETLDIAEPVEVDYSRGEWKHWVGSPCNTRQTVLIEQGENVVTGDDCKVISGSWVDPYSLETFTDAGVLDIDHVIPLSYAARMGGNNWSSETKEEFANDYSQLLAVSAKENRSKGDKGPADYMPPNKDFYCDYSVIWVETASKYDLAITPGDREVLREGLSTCG